MLTLYIEVHFIPTLKFPQAYTRPSCVNTAVWLSPADVCITLYGSFNIAGNVSEPSSDVSLPSADSSLQPNVYTCQNIIKTYCDGNFGYRYSFIAICTKTTSHMPQSSKNWYGLVKIAK